MFVTGLTPTNIVNREPAIAEYITDYATTLQTRIDEAKAVIDNKLRALGYDLDKIGKKTYFWNWDNEAGSVGNPNTKTITSFSTNDTLLILQTNESIDQFSLGDSNGIDLLDETITAVVNPARGFLISSFTGDESLTITVDTVLTANLICAYLTDPAIYFIHLYKSLNLIYESIRSNPGDLFEMKSNYYSDLYENELNNLVTYYDRNADGTSQANEFGTLKRTMIKR